MHIAGIVDAVQPSLPAAPQLTGPKASEPTSSLPNPKGTGQVPAQANAAVQEVQKGADSAVEAAPGELLSVLRHLPPGQQKYKRHSFTLSNIAASEGLQASRYL